tara:strand:+ start:111 stop:419 length:309 start_codon:yes stop_codon:yes gene_type:complete
MRIDPETWKYVSREGDAQASVLLRGSHKFSGVIYSYGRINVPEPTSDGFAQLSFDYTIEDNNNIPRDEFDEEFFTLIGDILVDIIDQKLEEETLIFKGGTDE